MSATTLSAHRGATPGDSVNLRRMLHDSGADFAARATDTKRVRALRDTSPGYDHALWRSLAAQGWLGSIDAMGDVMNGGLEPKLTGNRPANGAHVNDVFPCADGRFVPISKSCVRTALSGAAVVELRSALLPITAALATLLSPGAAAQSTSTGSGQVYPTKTVRIVAPFPPGGPVDMLGRLLAGRLSGLWGQQVIVDNRPGGNTVIGTEIVARSPPDGYTILLNSTGFAVNATLYAKLPYDPISDFVHIGSLASGPGVLVVHPSFPATTLKALIALAKAKPGTLTYGSAGNGTVGHLTIEMLKKQAGIDMVHIPYKGAAPAIIDLIGGQVPISAPNISAVLGHIRSGRVRALAVSSGQRWPSLPNVPTYAEAALPGYQAINWYGLFAAAGTPAAIVTKISADAAAIMQLPQTRDTLESVGVGPLQMSPEAFTAFIKSEIVRWGEAVKASGARTD